MRLTALSLAMLLAADLPGCASNVDGWLEDKQVDALPAIFIPATAEEIQRQCPRVNGPLGCAVRDWKNRICRIYVEAPPKPWIASHELYHCAGFSHPL